MYGPPHQPRYIHPTYICNQAGWTMTLHTRSLPTPRAIWLPNTIIPVTGVTESRRSTPRANNYYSYHGNCRPANNNYNS